MPIYVLQPKPPLEGSLGVVCDSNCAAQLLAIESNAELRRYCVRATISDVVPLIGELGALLGPRPYKQIVLSENPLPVYLHRGGRDVTYFKLVADGTGALLFVEVVVETRLPLRALLLGRLAINRYLDSEARAFNLPLVIARLDVLTTNSSTVLASELVLPYKSLVRYGPIGGVGQSSLFAPWLSLLREASTATSPFYRLLCAWRAYDGVGFLRKTLKQQADALGLSERLPRDPELDLELLRSSGASEEFMTGLRRAGDLFARLTEMRNGVGHFLLDSGEHVYMSDPAAYRDYSLASYVLLTAASDSIAALQGYSATHIEPRTSVGSLGPDRTMADQLIVHDAQSGGPPR